MAIVKDTIELTATNLPHVFMCDVDDSGLLTEILLVKKFSDGTISYVKIPPLHPIDKARIKKIVTSQHADKYECWDLLSQAKLSNGCNALDYVHNNFVETKRPKGAKSAGAGLSSITAYAPDEMIGSDFVDPSESSVASI